MIEQNTDSGLHRLMAIVAQLRDPHTGCPWDLKQTHQSLRPYMLEEAYELVAALDTGDPCQIKEELGDVLLQVALHAQLASESADFDLDEVAHAISDKLVRRHPHVFSDVQVDSAEEVTTNWEQIKAAEKGDKGQASIMADIPQGMPALSRALKVSKKAVSQGFEWPDFESLWACVMSEYDEFRQALASGAPFEDLEDELGDILFATVNLARYQGIDPEVALAKATQKFIRRYQTMEQLSDKPLSEQPFETLDALWNQAKQACRLQSS